MYQIGKRLREYREAKGWTRVQLGVYAGVSTSTVSLAESGGRTPNAETLGKLARALDVEPGDLFAEAASPKAQAPSSPETSAEERRSILDKLSPLLSYMEQRADAYKQELEDPNSPYFRNADSAAKWAADLNREASQLSSLLIEEARPHMKYISSTYGPKSAYRQIREGADLLRHVATLFEVSHRATARVEAMRTKPDEVYRKKMEKEQREFQERRPQLEEELRYAHV